MTASSNVHRVDPQQIETNEFWLGAMRGLAEQHARAIANIDYFDTTKEPQDKIKQIDLRLMLANYALLQQSDTRWGTTRTNRALLENGHSCSAFREEAERAHKRYTAFGR